MSKKNKDTDIAQQPSELKALSKKLRLQIVDHSRIEAGLHLVGNVLTEKRLAAQREVLVLLCDAIDKVV